MVGLLLIINMSMEQKLIGRSAQCAQLIFADNAALLEGRIVSLINKNPQAVNAWGSTLYRQVPGKPRGSCLVTTKLV